MLDRFISGDVNRISPEAPVPILEVRNESCFLGGAANVAKNLANLSSSIYLSGRVGNDEEAAIIRRMLYESGIESLIVSNDKRTTVKTRLVSGNQQIARVDKEEFDSSKEVSDALISKINKLIHCFDAIIVEDYNKGLISNYFLDKLFAICPENLIVTLDPNPKNEIDLKRGFHTIKPNLTEARRYSKEKDIGADLKNKWGSRVLITMGERGALLYNGDKEAVIPSLKREVYDVSGAGDTFIAVYTLCLCSGLEPEESAGIANFASGIVVSKKGTSPIEKHEFSV